MEFMEKKFKKIQFNPETLLGGVHGRIHHGTVFFEDKTSTPAIIKQFRENQKPTNQTVNNRIHAMQILKENGIEHLLANMVKVKILKPGEAISVGKKESSGEWIQVSEPRLDKNGKSILFSAHENAKIPYTHAKTYLSLVAALANTGLFPSTDAIHTIHPPQSEKFDGKCIIGDFDRLVEASPGIVAEELNKHLKNVDVPDSEKWDHAMFIHHQLNNEELKNKFRLVLLAEKRKK